MTRTIARHRAPEAVALAEPTAAGADLAATVRGWRERVLGTLRTRTLLDDRDLANDLVRSRRLHVEALGTVIADAARHGADDHQLRSLGERVRGWVAAQLPAPPLTLREALERSAREEAEADVALGAALLTLDPTSLRRAIDEIDEELEARRQLRDRLELARRQKLGLVA